MTILRRKRDKRVKASDKVTGSTPLSRLRFDLRACGDKPLRSPIVAGVVGRIFAEPTGTCCPAASVGLGAALFTSAGMDRTSSEGRAPNADDETTNHAPTPRKSARKQGRSSTKPLAHTLLPREACTIDPGDPYLSLRRLSAYSGVSIRTLRAWIKDALHPLPYFRVGGAVGKVLVRRSDFDRWMTRHRVEGDADLDALVRGVLDDVA